MTSRMTWRATQVRAFGGGAVLPDAICMDIGSIMR
jgi:hypothetical protein